MRIDRSQRSQENEHFIKLSNVNKLAVNKLDKCNIPYTVPNATVPTQFNQTLWT